MVDNIKSKWKKIRFAPENTRGDINNKLTTNNVDLNLLHNSVYIIRLAGAFAVDYEKAISPVLYIGQGHFRGRLVRHRKWLGKLHALIPETPIEVKFCYPSNAAGSPLSKELEGYLLQEFKRRFGELPLHSNRQEKASPAFSFDTANIGHLLGPGAGKKYDWAIRALKANPLRN